MKKTYFYSQEQKDLMVSFARFERRLYTPKYINGKEYTYCATKEGEHKSNWSDAVIVHVETGCELNEWMFEHFGERFAK